MSEITLEKLRDDGYSELLHMLLNDDASGLDINCYMLTNREASGYLLRYAVTMILKYGDDPEMMKLARDSIAENLEDAAARVIKKQEQGNA